MKTVVCLAALAAVAGVASAQLSITETYIGIDGEDGTEDWFEVTNVGAAAIDTGNFFYDDVNPTLANAGQLDSFVLNPGESAVFLIASNPTTLAQFASVWGAVGNVGLTNGGGGLGQGGDEVNLLDAGGVVVDALIYGAPLSSGTFTIERLGGGSPTLSALGVNGAYESNVFTNTTLGTAPNFEWTLVGSPGVVPAPASAALLALGGLVGVRRRRA
ncbi:MAG: lamin tail domain-containing protein [Phycisphaerales bacterium]